MRLISRAEMARIARVSKPAITKACGKQLKAACQGDRVDLDHAAAAAYLATRGVTAPPARPARAAGKTDRAPTRPQEVDDFDIADPTDEPKRGRGRPRKPTDGEPEPVGHMRPPQGVAEGSNQDLKQLSELLMPMVERFGTDTRFSDWLSSIKDIELIREKRLKNGETEGGYISRELVKVHLLGAMEASNKRLLGDAAKTITAKVANIIRSGGGLEQAQRAVRDEISKQIKPVKEKAARYLRHKADAAKK